MLFPIYTRDQAKAAARKLRETLAKDGEEISHSAALERIAQQQGYANWNILSARLSNGPGTLQVGDRIAGEYLKQPMTGHVLACRQLAYGDAFEITIEFEEAIDVVSFDSFSNFRKRISTTVSKDLVSHHKTSDGIPHLVISQVESTLV